MASPLVPLLAGVVGLAFAGAVAAQWRRARRPYQLAWGLGLAAYAVASLADAFVAARGWTPPLYWGYLAAASGNVALLGLGTLYLLRWRPLAHGFAAFTALCLALIAVAGPLLVALPDITGAGPELGLTAVKGSPWRAVVEVPFILLSSVGGLALIGGALWSWRQSGRPGVLLIGIGALVVASGGTVVGVVERVPALASVPALDVRLLTQLFGIVVMFAGYLQGREWRPAQPARDPAEA